MKQSLLLLLGAALLPCVLFANNRKDGEYLHKVTSEFETPHLKWGQPLKGGPIRTLFITNRRFGAREVVELAQRMDISYEAFVAATSTSLTIDNNYEPGVMGTSRYEKNNELLEKLRQQYDVIVLANVGFSILPPAAQHSILKHVSDGRGLVIAYPGQFPYPKALANPTEDWKSILSAFDTNALPWKSAPLTGEKLLKTYKFGEGRIAILNYAPVQTPRGLTSSEKYTPEGWKARYENSIALAGRTIQWAAGRPVSNFTRPEIAEGTVKFPAGENQHGNVRLRLRDVWNREIFNKDASALDISDLPAGQYYLDVLLGDGKNVSEFGNFGFVKASPCGVVNVESDKLSYEKGETVPVSLTLEKPLEEDAEVLFTLEDLPSRRVWQQVRVALPKGEREVKAHFAEAHVPTIAGIVFAEIRVKDKPLASANKIVYFPRREKEIFPTILWSGNPAELSEMYALQTRESLYDATTLSHMGKDGEEAKRAALFNERFIPYMTRVGLGNDENNATVSRIWLGLTPAEVKDATGGDGSFYNPAVRELWKKSIERRISGLPEVGPFIYTLGDENFFSYGAGYSPADAPAFIDFLKNRYGDIAALNKAWNTSWKNFDEIERPSYKEIREKQLYTFWNAHRSFMEKQYADVHHFLAAEIKKTDPHALVGAEGSVPGDLELTLDGLDFWGPYKHPVEDELLRSLAPEKLRTVWWGYGGEFMAYPLWSQLLKGVINGNSWYSNNIEAVSGLMSSDFSLAEYYKNDRKPYVDALNAGVAQLLVSTPLQKDGIAIFWSQASKHASVMDERFMSPQDSAVPLMNHLYKSGLNFNYLTGKMIKAGGLEGYRILWLFGATALSDEESKAIKQFVHDGGIVVADINPGILNDSCGTLSSSSLASLFGTPDLKGAVGLEMKNVSVEKEVRGTKLAFQAEKAWQSPEAPVFAINEYGKGLAILLNFNLGTASNTAITSLDEFLAGILDIAGIRSAVKVEGINDDQLVLRIRRNAENQVIGLLANRTEIGKTVSLTLPETAWVYEANKGLIGNTGVIKDTLDIPFKVYSVFSAEQKPPVLSLSKETASRGDAVEWNINNRSEHGLYRLEVRGPEGAIFPAFTTIVSGDSKEAAFLRFALNDAAGDYQITLRDIRTGLETQKSLNIQ